MTEKAAREGLLDPDAIFARLVEAQRDLDEAAALRFNARLVLLLAERIADDAIVLQAIEAARKTGG